MTEELRTRLREAADDHPEFSLHSDPWRRGRRVRHGRRLAGVAGATMTVAAVVAGTVLLTTPDRTSGPEPAEEEPLEPELPDTLYEVPENIPDIRDDPLGGPAAVVYTGGVRTGLFSEATRPLVVGAESGEVRAVRDAALGANVALSPDGATLAIGDDRRIPDVSDEPPTVLVVDLRTGKAETYVMPDEGLGGGVENLVWDSDSSRIAVTTDVITSVDGDTWSSRWVPGWLSLPDGEWDEHGLGEILAISRDGGRIVADGSFKPTPDDRMVVSTIDDAGAAEIADRVDQRGVAFSPQGRQIASVAHPGNTFTSSDRFVLEIFDADTGKLTTQMDLGEYADVRLVGWGDRGVLVQVVRQKPTLRTVVERIDVGGADNAVRETVLVDRSNTGRFAVAADFLDADVREANPPDAPFDWVGSIRGAVLLATIVLGGLGVITFVNRRVRSGRGSARGRGSTGH